MSANVKVSTFRDPTVCLEVVLQANQTANDAGAWVLVAGYEKKSIHIIITGNAQADLRGSNLPTKPDDANDDGVSLGTANAANAIIEHKSPVKWMKLKTTCPANSSVSGYLQGCP